MQIVNICRLNTRNFLTDCRFWHHLLQLPPVCSPADTHLKLLSYFLPNMWPKKKYIYIYICCFKVLKIISAFAGAPRWKDSMGERKKIDYISQNEVSCSTTVCANVLLFKQEYFQSELKLSPAWSFNYHTTMREFQIPNCRERYSKSLTFLSVINHYARLLICFKVVLLLCSGISWSPFDFSLPSLTKEPLQTISIQPPVDVTRHLCNQIHARLALMF